MKPRNTLLLGIAVALACSGCNSEEIGDGSTGTARVSALSAADVDRVDILIDGVIEATLTGGATSVTISDIPVGTYTFSANAYDEGTLPDASDDVLIYQGSAPGVTITEGTPVSVNIILQQLIDIPDPFANDVPIFQSLVYSPASPVVDEDVTLTVVVTDADGDPLTIAWTAVSGTVVPDDQLTVVWTTPSSPNTTPGYALTVTASDGSALAALTVEIPVDFETGDTNVTIKLNNFPLVSDLVPVPTRIDVVPGDDTTSLTLTASDPDGDALEYAWSASGCAGTFSDATATPDFTITDRLGGNTCTLSVEVTDVDASNGNAPYGGSTTADVAIATGPEVTANTAPPPPAVTCPCWDGSPGSVASSLSEVWSTLAPSNCVTVDQCLEKLDSTGLERSEANCVSDLPGNPRLLTLVNYLPAAAPGLQYRCLVQNESGQLVARLDLLEEEYTTCRDGHDAFTSTTSFPLPPVPPPPGATDEDPICGLPVPGSTPGSGVACATTSPGLVLFGTDFAGIGSVNPNILGQACVDEVGLLYLDNGCALTPSLERRSLCDQAFSTGACQSCLSVGSSSSCTACRTEIESRFIPACMGSGLPICE